PLEVRLTALPHTHNRVMLSLPHTAPTYIHPLSLHDALPILEHQIKTLTRKERTHRLCTRAAMLESYLPHPEAITDEQVSLFLKLLFRKDSTRQLMEKVFAGNGTEKEGAE